MNTFCIIFSNLNSHNIEELAQQEIFNLRTNSLSLNGRLP